MVEPNQISVVIVERRFAGVLRFMTSYTHLLDVILPAQILADLLILKNFKQLTNPWLNSSTPPNPDP